MELAARDAEAEALSQRGGKWLSGSIAPYASYISDETLDDTNMAEYELGLELPLWRWDERAAAKNLGAVADKESIAAAAALRHQVTGLLRKALWDIEEAVVEVSVAENGVAVATELLRVVTRRHQAGDLPLTDTLLAESTLLEREAALIASQALLIDAERAYRSLTGIDVRPAKITEVPNTREELNAAHPWLVMADAELARAEAKLDLAVDSVKGAPVLTVGSRRERASFSDDYIDSVGLQLKMPFGGTAHRSAQTATNLRAVAAAKADRAQLVRQLELDLHEALHTLAVVDASLVLTRQQSELAARGLKMSERAFEQGEMTLFELLQQQERAQNAESETARLEIERQRTIAEINQALGEGP
jgi:outer membrane protein TolC